jgi:hypothetical protein
MEEFKFGCKLEMLAVVKLLTDSMVLLSTVFPTTASKGVQGVGALLVLVVEMVFPASVSKGV